jgi:adenylate cyclase
LEAGAALQGEAIAENIINHLTQVSELRVVARTTAFRLFGDDLDINRFRSVVRVDAVLTGRIEPHGAAVRVQVDLIDTVTDSEIWGKSYIQDRANFFAVHEQIAIDLCLALEVRLSPQQHQAIVKRHTDDFSAYESYAEGRRLWNKRTRETVLMSIGHFRQAVMRRPTYALAYAGLADAYSLLPIYAGTRPREILQVGSRLCAACDRA